MRLLDVVVSQAYSTSFGVMQRKGNTTRIIPFYYLQRYCFAPTSVSSHRQGEPVISRPRFHIMTKLRAMMASSPARILPAVTPHLLERCKASKCLHCRFPRRLDELRSWVMVRRVKLVRRTVTRQSLPSACRRARKS